MDPAFEGVGSEKGLLIWRIEDFTVVPYPKEKYGQFFDGDSYIVLNTDVKASGALVWDIYFWLGTNTSQDEAGSAAIKSVELDDQLGGSPVQHREVQEHESASFLSRFKKGVRYLKGGVASGFRHVDPNEPYENRLFKVKGRKNVRVSQTEASLGNMNKSDCFILDAREVVYVYCGPNSRRMERMKAILTANDVRDNDHAGSSKILIIDESADEGDVQSYLEAIGGGTFDDIPDEEATEDSEHERTSENSVALYRIWEDENEQMQMETVSGKPLKQEMLLSGDCFLLDSGGSGIFAWIGRESSRPEKAKAMKMATKFLEEKGYPNWTNVERVIERGEPTVFKQYFKNWKDSEGRIGLGRTFTNEQIAELIPEPDFDVSSLHKRKMVIKNAGAAFGFMPDDGSGQVEVNRVENFELVPVDESAHGFFFGGDSYVLKYTYEIEGREKYIIYFWQGTESSQDEKASSAIHAVQMDNDLFGKAVQIRVCQGSETEHFLRIFKGRMVVFSGGKASGFKNVHDHDTYDADGTRLFQVRGVCEVDTRAIQRPEIASSLNSNDVFILETPSSTYLWKGSGSSDDEKTIGEKISGFVSPDRELVEIMESEEPEEFWSALGGQAEYEKNQDYERPSLDSRLFHCFITPNTGRFRVKEIGTFSQEDLSEDDVMILDSGDEVYVWIGQHASEEEKEKGFTMAQEYVATDPTERSTENCVIIRINQGAEPAAFTSLFTKWDANMWQEMESYEDLKQRIKDM